MRRSLLALLLMSPLFGCADRPAGQPSQLAGHRIVLRAHDPERQAARRVAPRPRSGVRNTVQATPVPLRPEPAADATTAAEPRPETAPDATTAAELRPEPAPHAAAAAELSSAQKEALFRDFDNYLHGSGRKALTAAPAATSPGGP
jgi:hypothetical protein